jgi:hypothetical protein
MKKKHNLLHLNFYCSVFNFHEGTTFCCTLLVQTVKTQFNCLVHLGCDSSGYFGLHLADYEGSMQKTTDGGPQ